MSERSNDDTSGNDEAALSAKAKEVKRQIRKGTYQINLESLADNLLSDGVLDTELEEHPADLVQNDQKLPLI